MITVSGSGPIITDIELNRLESALGITLPQSYREFLKKYNGGRPKPSGFPIQGLANNPKGIIQHFMGINQRIESSNLVWTFNTFKGRIPPSLLPCARDEGGSLICISLEGPDQGTIYYWYLKEEYGRPGYDNAYFVARNFSEFIESIHSYNPLKEDRSKNKNAS